MVLGVKNPPAVAGDLGSIPGIGRSPGGGHGNPLQHSYLENLCGQRSLVGYSPWGYKVLGLRCCVGFSLVAGSRGYALAAVCGLLIEVASLVAEHIL